MLFTRGTNWPPYSPTDMPPLSSAQSYQPAPAAIRRASGLWLGSQSAHGRPRLHERPAVTLEVLGLVGAEAMLMDRLDDLSAGRAGPGKVRVQVVDVDPRHVRDRHRLGGPVLRLENHDRVSADPEL